MLVCSALLIQNFWGNTPFVRENGNFTEFSLFNNFSMAILPLPLIQEEQLSVIGERMCTKYW